MAAGDEKKPVTLDELKAGVRLTAGHRVVLIVQGAVATTTTEAPETTETTTAAPEHLSTTTTAAPEESTTEAPEETTTAATESTTTSEPSSTTTATGTTTTAEPSSSTTASPGTSTTAPGTTTTGPGTTTTAPGTTTTKPPGAEVEVELNADVLAALPDGALVLSGDGIDEQQIAFADAEQADGVLRFTFKWEDLSKKVKLVATGSGKSVTLWEDQPAGDPSQDIVWSGAISDLYAPAEEAPGEPQSVGEMPENLHLRDDEVDQ
jgi:hypothetical protein